VKGRCADELSIPEIRKILGQAKSLGLRRVGLTGGEPLCDVEKLEEVARFCLDELDVPLHTHTNGTLIDEKLCNGNGVLRAFESVSVTFLGGDAETHDYMTATPESFKRALEGTKLLVSEGLPLTCYFIPTHGTCKGFEGLLRRLHDIGVRRIRPMALAPSGRARPIYRETAPLKDELQRFEEILLRFRDALGIRIEAGYCTRISMPQLSVLRGHEVCLSGINRVHINSRGDVFPCTASSGVRELRLGNLRENGFNIEEIWRGSELVNQIRSVHEGQLEACEHCMLEPKCRSSCLVNSVATISDTVRQRCPLLSQ
jgi:radical SAM protein with 4Fe4S-binding SPASM domain